MFLYNLSHIYRDSVRKKFKKKLFYEQNSGVHDGPKLFEAMKTII